MERSLTGIAPQQLAAALTRRLTKEPAIVLNGPRTVGKSILLTDGRLHRVGHRAMVELFNA